jgi:L-amino acid N-acyltransferase YncA
VASSPSGITVGALTRSLGISQSTCSFHVRRLLDADVVQTRKRDAATVITVNPTCLPNLPHALDAVLGLLLPRRSQPNTPVTDHPPECSAGLPADVAVRALEPTDWPTVRRIYAEGIDTGNATFETRVPSRGALDAKWLPDHRWVAEIDGEVVGWTAAALISARECYRGVAESSIYVADGTRGRGVGKSLLHRLVTAADADAATGGLWTLQTAIFTDNRASIALHHAAGFRTVGVRERIARRDGVWRDTVFLERRSQV